MILSFKEKKELTINLIEQGVSIREIARQTHLSYSTIGNIRKGIEDCTNEKSKKPLSISSPTFKIFEKHKTLIQGAIELDLTSEEVLKIHSQYLTLQNNQKFESILRENRYNLKTVFKFI
jgi:transposase